MNLHGIENLQLKITHDPNHQFQAPEVGFSTTFWYRPKQILHVKHPPFGLLFLRQLVAGVSNCPQNKKVYAGHWNSFLHLYNYNRKKSIINIGWKESINPPNPPVFWTTTFLTEQNCFFLNEKTTQVPIRPDLMVKNTSDLGILAHPYHPWDEDVYLPIHEWLFWMVVPWMVRPNEAPGGDKCWNTPGVSGDAFLFYLWSQKTNSSWKKKDESLSTKHLSHSSITISNWLQKKNSYKF